MKTNTFNDGIVKIYKKVNVADKGNTPKYELIERGNLRFMYRTIGLQRDFYAKQDNVQLSYLIRCLSANITTNDIAVIDDETYMISRIQHPEGHTPKVMDLELSKKVPG